MKLLESKIEKLAFIKLIFNKWFNLVGNSRSIPMKIADESLHRGQLNIRISYCSLRKGRETVSI